MPTDPSRLYWDANVMSSYVQDLPDRADVVEELLERATAGELTIFTSMLSRVEVAFAEEEHEEGVLEEAALERIEELWSPESPIELVELFESVALQARDLIRRGRVSERSLKPADAIHLATAMHLEVGEMHTYDEPLQRWSNELGFPIVEPIIRTPRLPGT